MQSDDGWNTRPGRVVVRIRQRAGTCWIRTSRGIGEDDVRRGKGHENPMTYTSYSHLAKPHGSPRIHIALNDHNCIQLKWQYTLKEHKPPAGYNWRLENPQNRGSLRYVILLDTLPLHSFSTRQTIPARPSKCIGKSAVVLRSLRP